MLYRVSSNIANINTTATHYKKIPIVKIISAIFKHHLLKRKLLNGYSKTSVTNQLLIKQLRIIYLMRNTSRT